MHSQMKRLSQTPTPHSKLAPLHSTTLAGQRRRACIAISSSNSQKGLQPNALRKITERAPGWSPNSSPGGMHLFWNVAPINWSLLGGREIESISLSSWFDGHIVLFYLSDNHQLRPDFGSGAPFEISLYFIHEEILTGVEKIWLQGTWPISL